MESCKMDEKDRTFVKENFNNIDHSEFHYGPSMKKDYEESVY